MDLKTKVVIFDFDGTLTSSSTGGNCWRYVWEEIGKTDVDDKIYDQYRNGEFDYKEWSKRVLKEFKDSKVDKALLEHISSKLNLRKGTEEVFSYLKSNNVKIYVFSGGIKQVIQNKLGQNIKYVDDIECEELIFGEDGIVKGSKMSKFDTENKSQFVKFLAKKMKIKTDEIFFVGNGRNDEKVHSTGAITLCINPDKTDPYNKECWDYFIKDIQDLQQILPYIK